MVSWVSYPVLSREQVRMLRHMQVAAMRVIVDSVEYEANRGLWRWMRARSEFRNVCQQARLGGIRPMLPERRALSKGGLMAGELHWDEHDDVLRKHGPIITGWVDKIESVHAPGVRALALVMLRAKLSGLLLVEEPTIVDLEPFVFTFNRSATEVAAQAFAETRDPEDDEVDPVHPGDAVIGSIAPLNALMADGGFCEDWLPYLANRYGVDAVMIGGWFESAGAMHITVIDRESITMHAAKCVVTIDDDGDSSLQCEPWDKVQIGDPDDAIDPDIDGFHSRIRSTLREA